MKLLIDADGCPVVEIAVRLCRKYQTPCTILCDTAHEIYRDGVQTIVADKGADSVDFRLVNLIQPGDIVVTQDYGLASMCLAKKARILHQDGWEYNEWNIQALLIQRHESRKYRAAGGRMKGPKKRTEAQNQAFAEALAAILRSTGSSPAADA